MPLLVVGSVALDCVETTTDRRDDILGGSAVYFSYAARFFSPVRMIGAVGEDWPAEHTRLLEARGITCSMSRAGEVWDNSAMESFFSTLKMERVHRKVYRTRSQARADVFDFIEVFYNPKRRHSTLGYVSPVQFEQALFA